MTFAGHPRPESLEWRRNSHGARALLLVTALKTSRFAASLAQQRAATVEHGDADSPVRVAPSLLRLSPRARGRVVAGMECSLHRRHLPAVRRSVPDRASDVTGPSSRRDRSIAAAGRVKNVGPREGPHFRLRD